MIQSPQRSPPKIFKGANTTKAQTRDALALPELYQKHKMVSPPKKVKTRTNGNTAVDYSKLMSKHPQFIENTYVLGLKNDANKQGRKGSIGSGERL